MGFLPALTLVFIILKLCEVITWSWLLVLSPMIIGAILGLFCLIIIAVAKS